MTEAVRTIKPGVQEGRVWVAFTGLLAVGWLVLAFVRVQAIRKLGLAAGGTTFISDMTQPWRAQFNSDFGLHLLLVAAWMIFRTRPWWLGVLCALLAINMGGMFTLAYLLMIAIRAQGDMRTVLLGWRAERAL